MLKHFSSLLLICLLSGMALSACEVPADNSDDDAKPEVMEEEKPAVPAQIPDENKAETGAIATVNGEEIRWKVYNDRLLGARRNALMGNRDPFDKAVDEELKEEVLTQLIQTMAVIQAAKEAEVALESGSVAKQIEDITQRAGGEESLINQLEENGSNYAEFEEDITNQLLTQQYLDDYIEDLGLEVSDDEVQAKYDEVAAEQENVPALDDSIKEQIRGQLLNEKKQEAVNDLAEKLADEADVVKFAM